VRAPPIFKRPHCPDGMGRCRCSEACAANTCSPLTIPNSREGSCEGVTGFQCAFHCEDGYASQSGEADGSTTCGTDGSFAAAACVGKSCADMPVEHTLDGMTSCSGQVHQSTHSTMDSISCFNFMRGCD
jgi:hypothetical protein